MKILFTSDLHSNIQAYKDFVFLLKEYDYDIGIIAGDLIEDYVSDEELIEYFNLTSDDLLEELPSAEESFVETMKKAIKRINDPQGYYMRALKIKENSLKLILNTTNKPILLVPGNHDKTEWNSWKNISNIHWKKINIGKYNFVGYCYTNFDRSPYDLEQDYQKLKHTINKNTIFVTHAPAYGILDGDYLSGNKDLRDLIKEKKPKYHLFGHIHAGYGYENNSINGSYPKERKFIDINTETNEVYKIPYKTIRGKKEIEKIINRNLERITVDWIDHKYDLIGRHQIVHDIMGELGYVHFSPEEELKQGIIIFDYLKVDYSKVDLTPENIGKSVWKVIEVIVFSFVPTKRDNL